jgi:hypothetical protein
MAMQQRLTDKIVAFATLAHFVGNPSELRPWPAVISSAE